MRDRHFMEDENELPYLVWENRDDNASRSSSDYSNRTQSEFDGLKTNEEKIDKILAAIPISVSNRRILKDKVISLFSARDCVNLNVEISGSGMYNFIFTRENEYVRTVDEFEYFVELPNLDRVFSDCYTSHNHDNLLKNPRFRNLIAKSGMEFIECRGGYVTDYSMAGDEFTFRDEIDVKVYFRVGSSKRFYKLDLDSMELSKDYFKY